MCHMSLGFTNVWLTQSAADWNHCSPLKKKKWHHRVVCLLIIERKCWLQEIKVSAKVWRGGRGIWRTGGWWLQCVVWQVVNIEKKSVFPAGIILESHSSKLFTPSLMLPDCRANVHSQLKTTLLYCKKQLQHVCRNEVFFLCRMKSSGRSPGQVRLSCR